MPHNSLLKGKLIRRYKRFLADVELASGEIMTVHCPNTGSMKNCLEEGAQVWLSHSDNTSRKYPYTWELMKTARGHFIGINTGSANKIVKQAVCENRVLELTGYRTILAEQKYGIENSRIDLLLTAHESLANCYVEIKSVTLLDGPVSNGAGYFPDSVSKRGTKHLRELIEVVRRGNRGLLFYCVQHSGIRSVSPATAIDPEYAETLQEAVSAGVEVVAYKVSYRGSWPNLGHAIPFIQQPFIRQSSVRPSSVRQSSVRQSSVRQSSVRQSRCPL